ncbi:MAG TPA: tetratricopeptide repeat protein, partial [Steroidobacteraceae bacterium]|nr:tetratricopeptide repeat protein [Steroidobacteraceae bacterium]
MRLSIAVPLLGLLGLPGTALAREAGPAPPAREADFRAGIELFRQSDFREALQHFLRAQQAGLDTPVLQYDLGVTYYRMGRYARASAQFRRLLRDPHFGDFARYNLGLIARRRGDQALAQHRFSTVAAAARSSALRALAQAQLRPIKPRAAASEPRGRSWHGVLETGGGFDDNVALLPRYSPLIVAGGGSPLLRAYAAASGSLSGNARHGLSAAGSLYETHYTRQSSLDLLIGKLGPNFHFPAGSWRLEAGLSGTYVRLGSSELESFGSLALSATHRLGDADVRLEYTLEGIGGGAAYGYLSGRESRLALRATWRRRNFELEVGPALTVSRRRDLAAASEFFSVSATRLQLDAYALWKPD